MLVSFVESVRILENFPINATQAREQANHGDNEWLEWRGIEHGGNTL